MALAGLSLLRRYQKWFIVLIASTLAASLLEVAGVGLVLPMANVLLGPQQPIQDASYGAIVNGLSRAVHAFPGTDPLVVLCIFFMVVALAKGVFKIIQDMVRANL